MAISNDFDLISITNGNICNNNWPIRDEYLLKVAKSLPDNFMFKNFQETATDYIAHAGDLDQQAFLYVVTETIYNYPQSFFSEKTFKPMVSKRPFVIVGPPGCLAKLKSLGFKTFDLFWDESYDQIEDNDKRILAVVNIIKSISNRSIEDLQNLCIEMQDVLNFNFDYFVNEFKKIELEKLELACIENLKPRYV